MKTVKNCYGEIESSRLKALNVLLSAYESLKGALRNANPTLMICFFEREKLQKSYFVFQMGCGTSSSKLRF